MAKKHRNRIWYTGLFRDDAQVASDTRKLPEGTIFFDRENLAYGYAVNGRLKPTRDEQGELIVNEEGYAQLPDLGKLTIIAVKGEKLDWKQIEKAPKGTLAEMGVHGDTIRSHYVMPLNKHTIHTVFEETDEMYDKFANSAMARAGGVEGGYAPTEDSVPEIEPGTSESHD